METSVNSFIRQTGEPGSNLRPLCIVTIVYLLHSNMTAKQANMIGIILHIVR